MADDILRQDLVDLVREEQHKRQRAPRVARAPRAEAPGADSSAPVTAPDASHAHAAQDFAGAPGEGDAGAPRKRRRRRRSGAAKGAAGNPDGAGESGS